MTGLRVEVENLCKSYSGQEVLKNIDFVVEPGQFVVLVGQSGSGKSTLLRILAGLEQPDSGRALLDGESSNGSPASLRVMFQEPRLLPWRQVVQNVRIGRRDAENHEVLDVLEQVGLRDRAREWPSVLSGGQKQRVALARALIATPDLLLLDEPLGALDALTRLEMQRLTEGLWLDRGFSAVLVTHDVDEAILLGDKVCVLESGRIAETLYNDLPRPRTPDAPEFGAHTSRLLDRVLGSPARSPREGEIVDDYSPHN